MRLIILLTFTFTLLLLPFYLTPATSAQVGCGSTSNPRAEGLVTTPVLPTGSSKFGTIGGCIIDPRAGFAPFKIPGYDDLKSLYYDQKSSSGLSTPPPPSTVGLLAYWNFDNESGTTAQDSSGNGNDGTLSATTTRAIGVSNKGQAINLDLSGSDYVNIGRKPALENITTNLTLSAWVNQKTTGVYNYIIANDRDCCGSYKGFSLRISSGTLIFQIWDSNYQPHQVAVNNATTNSINTWFQVAGTFDGITLKLYVNSGLVSQSVFSGSIGTPPTFPLYLGTLAAWPDNNGLYTFNGYLDEIRIYSRTLSQQEIQTLYNYTLGVTQVLPTQAVTKYPPASCKSSDPCQDESYFNAGGAGEISSDALYYIPGNLVLGQTNPLTSKNNTVVVFISGDLNIKKNLIYGNSNSGIVLVVKGNINVDPAVTRIDAVLISEGQFCSIIQSNGACKSSGSDQQLVINGSVISLGQNRPVFARSLSDNSQPAELINHQVKYLVILRNLMSDTFQRWSEIP